MKQKKLLLIPVMVIALCLFLFSLLKNIAYPLFWNDEAETVMFGERILKFGYPKVNDGKNIVYAINLNDKKIGIDPNNGAYVGYVWGGFYLAAYGVWLSTYVTDIYAKTALIRLPFVLVGAAGILIFAYTSASIFKRRFYKLLFFTVFIFFELFSVSLALHIRDVRHYPLLIFLTAICIHLYLDRIYFHKLSSIIFLIFFPLVLSLVFHVFEPALFIYLVFFAVHALINYILSHDINRRKILQQVAISLAVALFISSFGIYYFKTFEISAKIGQELQYKPSYFDNLALALSFFQKYEFLYLAVFVKLVFVALLYKKAIPEETKEYFKMSNFYTLFFITYITLAAMTPYMFERYVIVLQPILVMMLLLDCFIVLQMWKANRIIFVYGFLVIFVFCFINQLHVITGHVYELFNEYQGPLDFAIPYIQKKYPRPSNLIIATNYEENAYMFYLKSKTIVGYVKNNLDEDMKLTPDIIIWRKGQDDKSGIFNKLWAMAPYNKISFPVYDYYFNNIPELNLVAPHLFKTKLASDEREKLDMYWRD